VTKADLDPQGGAFHGSQEVAVEPEVTPPELVPQVPQAQASPTAPRVPPSCAGVVRSDLLNWKQVTSSDVSKVISDFAPSPPGFLAWFEAPVLKPQITEALPPPQKAQSDPNTVGGDFSGRKQVAFTRADNLFALFDAVYPIKKTPEAGRPAAPLPQRGPELSHPVVSKGSLGRKAKGALALGVAFVLTGFWSFYSTSQGGRQLQDPPAFQVGAPLVTPEQTPQRSSVPGALSAAQPFLTRTLGLKINRIAIDAGHGGHDTGAIGPTGLAEKDLCLDVALRLGQIIKLRLPGAEVIFTRTDDTFIPLEKRSNIANEQKADLFLSIHANSSPYDAARGVETYYLNLKGSREGLEVAARENAAAPETVPDLRELVKKIARSEKIKESREFAEDIQNALSRRIQPSSKSARNIGVHRAPFAVLSGANMPSVLTEISFLSNPSDEQLLKKAEYRQRLAEGLYQGVASYIQSLSSITYNLPIRSPAADRFSSGAFSAESAAVEQSRNQQ
jgi:N-acetylmuramoyl-L-alanine amidase